MRYHRLVADKIKESKERIANAKKCNEDAKIVTKLFPEAYIWVDYEVNMSFPALSMDVVKDALKKFANEGILIDHFSPSESHPVWRMKGKNVTIRFTPEFFTDSDTRAEGATCRLIKVGEETYTQNKYKLVCDGKEQEAV